MVAPRKRKPKGITCPTCEKRLRTLETRPRSDGSIRRIKGCKECGYRVESVERVTRTAA